MRVRKAGIRAVTRITAEKHAPRNRPRRGNASGVVVAEIGCRTCAHLYRHIFAVLANHHNFNITFIAGYLTAFFVVGIVAILELSRVGTYEELTKTTGRVALYIAFTAVRPTPNVPERIFQTSVAGYAKGLAVGVVAFLVSIVYYAGFVPQRISNPARNHRVITVIAAPIAHIGNALA